MPANCNSATPDYSKAQLLIYSRFTTEFKTEDKTYFYAEF